MTLARKRRARIAGPKKSVGATGDRLCGVGKSVKVSEDRTVVLTISGAFVAGDRSPARLCVRRDPGATAMLTQTVRKDRKKYAA
ncbi:MAG: hypothetical protein ABSG83_02285 [Roseiarcus sp.]|jgi:hypothetical protein